jgi:hypothetical protein
MPTQAQIDANRLNAQKSTGPTSPEGKAASSLNALKSGIDAWSHVIPGEDPAELEALTAAYLLHYRPAGPTQLSLVDTLISTEWIQRRLRRVEAQLWNYRVECLDQNLTHAEFVDASIQHNSPLGHSYQDAIDPFARIQRRIDATNRMYLRTLKVLQELQAAAPTPVSEPPSPLPTHPHTPPIGFVPRTVPESGEPAHASRGNQQLPTSHSGESARRGGADFSLRGLFQHPVSVPIRFGVIANERQPSADADRALAEDLRCLGISRRISRRCRGDLDGSPFG